MPDTSIGFIGLGIMGAPMAANLARAGYPLVVHNRSRSKVERFVAEHEGPQAAATPKEVAERTDAVITMLPDSPEVEQVYLGEDGVIAGARAGQLAGGARGRRRRGPRPFRAADRDRAAVLAPDLESDGRRRLTAAP
jgi:NAD binding domain of 6-phosphogluconate dehydrogenase